MPDPSGQNGTRGKPCPTCGCRHYPCPTCATNGCQTCVNETLRRHAPQSLVMQERMNDG